MKNSVQIKDEALFQKESNPMETYCVENARLPSNQRNSIYARKIPLENTHGVGNVAQAIPKKNTYPRPPK